MSNYVRASEEDFGENSEAIFDPVNDTEETAWNENYPAERYHIEFLKERIERLEMENDALLAEIISWVIQ